MSGATLRFALAPLALALLALGLREASRETPSLPLPGRGAPLVPRTVVALLARRLPLAAELAVDPARSRARLSYDDADLPITTFEAGGSLQVDEHGELLQLELVLTPRDPSSLETIAEAVSLRSLACRPRPAPVDALRAASATARWAHAASECELELDLRWTALPDGSFVAQGEGRPRCAGFGLPGAGWTRILHTPPVGTLAFTLVLTRRG